jgi:hypothetical protein
MKNEGVRQCVERGGLNHGVYYSGEHKLKSYCNNGDLIIINFEDKK